MLHSSQKKSVFFLAALFLLLTAGVSAQIRGDLPFLEPADTFHRGRFYTATGTATALYAGASVGLYAIWYRDFERSSLRSFDDWNEWEQMDKVGHAATAYQFSRVSYAGLRWAGTKPQRARYAALGVANLLQGTIEILDGYSEQWGFSWYDMAANLSGSLLFTLQDIAWSEQRVEMKVSNDFRAHPDEVVVGQFGDESNLEYISRRRFGDNYPERYFKDYNAQTIWLSANVRSFLPANRGNWIPEWANLALGYGVENVYGAQFSSWSLPDVRGRFRYSEQRHRQWYLSPDISLRRIPTKRRGLKLLFGVLDFIKVPMPAVEVSREGVRGRWLY